MAESQPGLKIIDPLAKAAADMQIAFGGQLPCEAWFELR
jgi:hypothetical protein